MGIEVYAYCGWIVPSKVILEKMIEVVDPEPGVYRITAMYHDNEPLEISAAGWDSLYDDAKIQLIDAFWRKWYPHDYGKLMVVRTIRSDGEPDEDEESRCMIVFASVEGGYPDRNEYQRYVSETEKNREIFDFMAYIQQIGLYAEGKFGVVCAQE